MMWQNIFIIQKRLSQCNEGALFLDHRLKLLLLVCNNITVTAKSSSVGSTSVASGEASHWTLSRYDFFTERWQEMEMWELGREVWSLPRGTADKTVIITISSDCLLDQFKKPLVNMNHLHTKAKAYKQSPNTEISLQNH